MVESSKNVDTPFQGDWQSILGLILIVIVGMVANTAGVGGGAIFVPIFQALVGFPLKESTALSQALITAGSIVSMALQVFSPSPVEPTKPLIDFSLVLLLLPVLLVGVGIGVLLNVILPAYVISCVLFLLMCLLITQSLGKGLSMWRSETKKKAEQDRAAAAAAAAQQASVGLSLAVHKEEVDEQGNPTVQAQQATDIYARSNAGSTHGMHGMSDDAQFSQASDADARAAASTGMANSAIAAAAGTGPGGAGGSRSRRSSAGLSARGPPPTSSAGAARRDWRAFRPVSVALPSHAPDAGSWIGRRNAWLVHFMQAGNELGAEEDAGAWNAGQNGDGGEPSPDRQRRGGMQRTLSMPLDGLTAPLLSAADSAAARIPHGHKRLPPEQWDLSAGRSEEELLQALSGDLNAYGASPRSHGAAFAGGASPSPFGMQDRTAQDRMDGPARHAADVQHEEDDGSSRHSEDPWGHGQQQQAGSSHRPSVSGSAMRRVHATHLSASADGDAMDSSDGASSAAGAGAGGSSSQDGNPSTGIHAAQSSTSRSKPTSRDGRTRTRRVWVALCAYVRDGWARLPKTLVLIMVGCWGAYVALQLVRSLSRTCSPAYWGLFAAQLVLMPAFSLAASAWMERQKRAEAQVHELEMVLMDGEAPAVIDEEDKSKGMAAMRVKLRTWGSWLTYQALALAAGVIGGLLGLGGGMIIGPVLLELGVHPQVSSATSSAMVLFSSSTALISLAALGMLNASYAAAFSVSSMLASVLGVVVIGGAIRKTGRVSLVVLALACVMLIGGLAVGGFGITIVMDAVKSGKLGTAPLCPA